MSFKEKENLKVISYLLGILIVSLGLYMLLNLRTILDFNTISSKWLLLCLSTFLLLFLFIRYELTDTKNMYINIVTMAFVCPIILQLVFVNALRVTIDYQILNFIFYFSASFLVLVNLKRIKFKKIKTDKWELIFLIMIIGFFIYSGTQHLGQFMSVDEPKWLDTRVPQLYEAIRTKSWEDTFINDKPGILPSYLAGITNFFLDKSDYQNDPLNYETYLFYWRLPILFFNALLLLPIYFFSRKLLDKKYATAITSLIALNPILIGISQIVNPDATLWAPTFLSFITFLLYIKENNRKYILFSGIFLGLALTSKFSAAVLYPTFLIILYLEYLTTGSPHKDLLKGIISVLLLFSISSITYGVLVPATWVHYGLVWARTIGLPSTQLPLKYISFIVGLGILESSLLKGALSNLIRKQFNIIKVGILALGTINIAIFLLLILNQLFSGKLFTSSSFTFIEEHLNFLTYTRASFQVMLIVSTLPLVIGFFFIVTTFLRKPIRFKRNESFIILSSLLLNYILIVGTALSGFGIAARYQIFLLPINALITSFFFVKIIENFKIVITLLIALSLVGIFISKPFYFHYNNIVAQKIGLQTTYLWGYGGYELAKIMNQLPNAEELIVWVDREGFQEFFVGTSLFRSTDLYNTNNQQTDYLILTDGGERIFRNAVKDYFIKGEVITHPFAKMAVEENLLDLYRKKPEYIFCINGEKGISERTSERCVWVVEFDKEYVHEEQ